MNSFKLMIPAALLLVLAMVHNAAAGGVDCKYNIDNTKGKNMLVGQVSLVEGDQIRIGSAEYYDKKEYTFQVEPGKELEIKANGDSKCVVGAGIQVYGDDDNVNVSTLGYKKKDGGEGGEVDCQATGEDGYKGDFLGKYNCVCDGNVSEKNHYSRITITAK